MKKSEIRVALDALKEIKLPKIEDKDIRNTIIENHFILLDASRKVDEKVEDNRKVFLAAHKAEEKAVNELKAKIVEATNRDNKVALSKELREKYQCYFDAVDEFNESVDKLYAEEVPGLKPIDREKFIEELKNMDDFNLAWVEALYPLFMVSDGDKQPKKE